jgi:pyruvate-ferredoxin/flavodoxin oxidoreductase
MDEPRTVTIDGNEAAASVAYRLNEVIAVYPITPASPMGEWADQWAAEGRTNLWGAVPRVVELQSEAGAAGAVHGALQTGSLATTFTASQGLLLMLPNLYKIAGELTPAVFHVAARAVATHALSIFGDHSDVMAARATGWALLCSGSVQEALDLALVAQAATLEARIPFLHFFDGFRTSHEVLKVQALADEDLRWMLDEGLIRAHRARALSPDRPLLRGSAQNPDVFFQGREAANPFYLACPEVVQRAMDRFAARTGRRYRLFDYEGDPAAERVLVLMGSGAETAGETVDFLRRHAGAKVGVLKVRLFRPFSVRHFLEALPPTVEAVAVLDRTKEPGSAGEPLYQDVVTALAEGQATGAGPAAGFPRVIGGRYGLASKEFTPAMVKAVFDELGQLGRERPRTHFTVGIVDDVTHTSLDVDPAFVTEGPAAGAGQDGAVRALFYGLGSDGTVGANKNSIKIIGEETAAHAQGYFVYDSKKAGSTTVSHLRFGPRPIRSAYLITSAGFVACHQWSLLGTFDGLERAEAGATFLLNSPYGPDEVWAHLPRAVQAQLIDKGLRLFVIDGDRVARETGMRRRVNTVMQTCFFALAGVLPREQAVAAIKRAIQKTYGKRGEAVVRQNFAAVDAALAHLHEVPVPALVSGRTSPGASLGGPQGAPGLQDAPPFVQDVTAALIAGLGDALPVSALPADGTFPTATAQWEKRNLALELPVWDPEICIQCGKCVLVCPHAVIREKVYPGAPDGAAPDSADGTTPGAPGGPGVSGAAPETFKSAPARWREFPGWRYTLQVAPEDCTGCALCVEACPVKDKRAVGRRAINMAPQAPLRAAERDNWAHFLALPEVDRSRLDLGLVKDTQLLRPLFEFSGACAGCGETPYLSLLTRLFGDRVVIANATGCSSIYGGNLPTTPWAQDAAGRGPAWANSLFEDNAEFGLGFRVSLDAQAEQARALLAGLSDALGPDLVRGLLDASDASDASQRTEAGIAAQRERVAALKEALAALDTPEARRLLDLADALVRRSVWLVGGDGWAYDIGYGGLDHVLASGADVNVLVLDTEVYSNTGGQQSKATPRGAVAKFAAGGKATPKKDLGLLAMSYGHVYVARVAMGANDTQTLKAFREAEAYPGPSLILAYSHCIAHGYDLRYGLDQQKRAVASGHWPLFRFHPDAAGDGKHPLVLDSRAPSIPLREYAHNEGRYRILAQAHPEEAERLLDLAQEDARERWRTYEELAARTAGAPAGAQANAPAAEGGAR